MTDKSASTSNASTTTSKKSSASAGSRLVELCETCRVALFMMPTPHNIIGKCDRCDAAPVALSQYPRSELRLDHLTASDRDELNAKLDAAAAEDDAAIAATEAAEAAAAKAAEDKLASDTAANDARYAAAVAARQASDKAEAEATGAASKTGKAAA